MLVMNSKKATLISLISFSLFLLFNTNLFAQCQDWVLTGGNPNEEVFFSGNAVTVNSEKDLFFAVRAESFPITLNNRILKNDSLLNGGMLVIGKVDSTGSYDWTKQIEFNNTGVPHGLASDGTDIYLIASFRDSFVLDQQLYINNEWGIVIMKLSSEGDVQWVKNYELQPTVFQRLVRTWAPGIACDSEGNVIVTGYFSAKLELETTTLETNITEDHRETFVIKLDGQGNEIWAIQSNSLPYENLIYSRGWGIDIDKNDDILIGGFFSRQISFDTVTVGLLDEAFVPYVAKINGATGKAVWIKNGSFPSAEFGFSHFYGIAIDGDDNIIAVGYSDTAIALGDTVVEASNAKGIIVVKFDADGNINFVRNYGSSFIPPVGGNAAISVETDANNNIYISGFISESVVFDDLITPKYNSVFLVTLDPMGTVIELDQIGGRIGGTTSYSMTYDQSKNIYIGGYYTDIDTIFYSNERDTLITEYKNGFILWKKCIDPTLTSSTNVIPSTINALSLLFPNPSQDFIQLQLNTPQSQNASIHILKETGQIVNSFERSLKVGENTLRFEVKSLPMGIYFLHLKSGGHVSSHRFIKL